MAIPIKPKSSGEDSSRPRVQRPIKSEFNDENINLSSLDIDSLEATIAKASAAVAKFEAELAAKKAAAGASVETPSKQRKEKKQKPAVSKVSEETSSAKPLLSDSDIPDGWARDEKTGKLYKKLFVNSEETVKAFKNEKGKIGIDFLFRHVEQEEDLDVDDLNSSAEIFLSHLRVPPNKEEQAALRKEKAERTRMQTQKYDELHKAAIEEQRRLEEEAENDD